MKLEISKSKLKGKIIIPASKSLSHRAIIAAALSNGKSEITNLNYSNDIKATIKGMEALGTKFIIKEDKLIVEGKVPLERIKKTINCKESGSTIRFLIPLSLLADGGITFIGEGLLPKRPQGVYFDIFDEQKIKYEKTKDTLPLFIDGKLKGGLYKVKGNISSQFITGLLFTLPLLNNDSTIEITTKLESKGYIDLTLDILCKFGIEIENLNYEKFIIKGNQEYKSLNYNVEGDYSQIAFWMVAGSLGAELKLFGMNKNSLQGDKVIHKILKDMKAEIKITDGIEVLPKETMGTTIDLSQCPDLGPIVAVLASLSKGTTHIINASRLRIKESDRIESISTELRKLGAKIKELEDGMIIEGIEEFEGGCMVDSWNDHRIAMALAIAGTRCKNPIVLTGAESVEKSYPEFWNEYKRIHGNIKEIS